MVANNPHSVDRSYKFMYRVLGILFHRYFYREGEKLEFTTTELSDTGQQKDMAAIIDDAIIQITEFMAKALYPGKLRDLFGYHDLTRIESQNDKMHVKTGVISIANPNHGINKVEIDDNITFHVHTIFTKNRNGWKVLSSLIYKTVIQEELSDEEAIDLLILPDMDIKMPIKALMMIIIFLIGHANIKDENLKRKIILCEIKVLARFFKGSELTEMIEMLKSLTEDPEINRITEKYGIGFDVIYFDGKSDEKLEIARNLLNEKCDLAFISRNTGLSINEIKELKRKL